MPPGQTFLTETDLLMNQLYLSIWTDQLGRLHEKRWIHTQEWIHPTTIWGWPTWLRAIRKWCWREPPLGGLETWMCKGGKGVLEEGGVARESSTRV